MAWILWAHDVGVHDVGSHDLGLRWAEGLLGRDLGRACNAGSQKEGSKSTVVQLFVFLLHSISLAGTSPGIVSNSWTVPCQRVVHRLVKTTAFLSKRLSIG